MSWLSADSSRPSNSDWSQRPVDVLLIRGIVALERLGSSDPRGSGQRPGLVPHYLADPLSEPIRLAAALPPPERLEEAVVAGVLRVHPIAEHGKRHGVRGAIVAPGERLERHGISSLDPLEEEAVGHGVDRQAHPHTRCPSPPKR